MICAVGAHNRHYVIGSVSDWSAYAERKGKAIVKLLNSPIHADYVTIHTWDSVYYGAAFFTKWSDHERTEMQQALRRAQDRGRQFIA